jgi:hypothetical protein
MTRNLQLDEIRGVGLTVHKASKEYKFPPTALKRRLLISSAAKETQISTETAPQFDL